MTKLQDIVGHLDDILQIKDFKDYGPNGLQIEGCPEVKRVVCGVSANMELLEKAIELDAQLVVVHHGLIWGPGLTSISGVVGKRVAAFCKQDISLAAYHLPLDKHATLGNNAGIARALNIPVVGTFGNVRGHDIGLVCEWNDAKSKSTFESLMQEVFGRIPFQFWHGQSKVRRVGICSGAASDLLEAAASAGCDLFLTGELAERAGDTAKELSVNLVAAGHYATEVFGPQSLAQELQAKFSNLSVTFAGTPTPL